MAHTSSIHGSAASARRLKARRAAETRLKVCGIAAIVVSFVALAVLMFSVFGKAVSALSESYITLPVDLAADQIDPQATADPAVIGRANFGGVMKDTLKAAFPQVRARGAKRQLYDVVSSGAAFELRQMVMDAPSLIGSRVAFAFLASDTTDLYLKGAYGGLRLVAHGGSLRLASDGDAVSVTSDAADFAAALAQVKRALAAEAARVRRQAMLEDNGVRAFQARLDGAEGAALADIQAQVAARSARRDALLAEAATLAARAADPAAPEALGPHNASVLIRAGGGWIKLTEIHPNGGIGAAVAPPAGDAFAPADWALMVSDLPEAARKISDQQIVWVETLRDQGAVETRFNARFFTAGDSREPELAGIWSAAVGSFWTMLVTFLLAFPIGVASAIYLEEFAPKNRLTDLIEVNINNLAAVPSIIFGLLGLSVVIGFFGVPRSAPLAGGIVLALMTLPTIIIASRASIAAVPPSIREAALGVGASRLQTAFHHVLPLAMPGVLTGTIIGMARALGETAPLIMIGMVAFIVDVPEGVTDSASVLPVQVYRWADFPERAFEGRTAAAICTLLVFLIVMNALAVFLRKRFERRW